MFIAIFLDTQLRVKIATTYHFWAILCRTFNILIFKTRSSYRVLLWHQRNSMD